MTKERLFYKKTINIFIISRLFLLRIRNVSGKSRTGKHTFYVPQRVFERHAVYEIICENMI
jgi:hypothetical protein